MQKRCRYRKSLRREQRSLCWKIPSLIPENARQVQIRLSHLHGLHRSPCATFGSSVEQYFQSRIFAMAKSAGSILMDAHITGFNSSALFANLGESHQTTHQNVPWKYDILFSCIAIRSVDKRSFYMIVLDPRSTAPCWCDDLCESPCKHVSICRGLQSLYLLLV